MNRADLERLVQELEIQEVTPGVFLVEAGYDADYAKEMGEGYYDLYLKTAYLKRFYPEQYGKAILHTNWRKEQRNGKAQWVEQNIFKTNDEE